MFYRGTRHGSFPGVLPFYSVTPKPAPAIHRYRNSTPSLLPHLLVVPWTHSPSLFWYRPHFLVALLELFSTRFLLFDRCRYIPCYDVPFLHFHPLCFHLWRPSIAELSGLFGQWVLDWPRDDIDEVGRGLFWCQAKAGHSVGGHGIRTGRGHGLGSGRRAGRGRGLGNENLDGGRRRLRKLGATPGDNGF